MPSFPSPTTVSVKHARLFLSIPIAPTVLQAPHGLALAVALSLILFPLAHFASLVFSRSSFDHIIPLLGHL